MTLAKRFASLMKQDVPRSKRAKVRQLNKEYQEMLCSSSSRSVTPNPPLSCGGTSSMAVSSLVTCSTPFPTPPPPPLTVQVGEQLEVDYSVHELSTSSLVANIPTEPQLSNADQSIINRSLLACVEFFESENDGLKKELIYQKIVQYHSALSKLEIMTS